MEEIDLLVSVTGIDNELVDRHTTRFLSSLAERCKLKSINTFLVLRECLPISDTLRGIIAKYTQFKVVNCSLPRLSNVQEDVAVSLDWMVENIGDAPWVCVCHFDVEFHADYFSYLRSKIQGGAVLVGRHHDGIFTFLRSAYKRCAVGFGVVSKFRIYRNSDKQLYIVAGSSPQYKNEDSEFCLSLDVGELLELRANTLGFKHVWHTHERDPAEVGKSELFTHHRNGSGHDVIAAKRQDDISAPRDLKRESMNQLLPSGNSVTLIHFVSKMMVPPTDSEPEGPPSGQWRIACMPNMVEFHQTLYHPAYHRTDDPRAVTCPACMKSTAFKESKKNLDEVLGRPRGG